MHNLFTARLNRADWADDHGYRARGRSVLRISVLTMGPMTLGGKAGFGGRG